MRTRYWIPFLLTVVLLASCQQLSQPIDGTQPDITPQTSIIKDSVRVSCSLSQRLLAGPFKENMTPKDIVDDKDGHFTLAYETDVDPDDKKIKDTDVIVSSGNSEFRFMKTGKEDILYKATLHKNTVVLQDNCKIGMHRQDFIVKNRLQLADSCNAVMVLSRNEALMVTVSFRGDTIHSIIAEMLGD